MGSAPASLADNPFLITLLLEMQTTIFLRTEMSRKTEYVHNPCFLSANILKILGVFAENQIKLISTNIAIPFENQALYSFIFPFSALIIQPFGLFFSRDFPFRIASSLIRSVIFSCAVINVSLFRFISSEVKPQE